MQTGKIMTDILSQGFQVVRTQMLRLTEQAVQVLYAEHVGRPYFQQLQQHMTSDVVVGIEVAGQNVIEAMRQMAGPTNP